MTDENDVRLNDFETGSLDLILAPTDAERRLPQIVEAVERIVRERVNAALGEAAVCIDAAAHEYRDDDAGFHYQDAAAIVRSLRFPPGGGSDG